MMQPTPPSKSKPLCSSDTRQPNENNGQISVRSSKPDVLQLGGSQPPEPTLFNLLGELAIERANLESSIADMRALANEIEQTIDQALESAGYETSRASICAALRCYGRKQLIRERDHDLKDRVISPMDA